MVKTNRFVSTNIAKPRQVIMLVPTLSTSHANKLDTIVSSDETRIIKLVTEQFVIPLRKGLFHQIDRNNSYFKLLSEIGQLKSSNSLILAQESMSASVFAKTLRVQLNISTTENSTLQQTVSNLNKQIDQLKSDLEKFADPSTQTTLGGFTMSGNITTQTIAIFPLIATLNPILGWYYYFNGYHPEVGIDPTKYLEAEQHYRLFPSNTEALTTLMQLYYKGFQVSNPLETENTQNQDNNSSNVSTGQVTDDQQDLSSTNSVNNN